MLAYAGSASRPGGGVRGRGGRCAGEGREGVNLEARNQQSKLPRNYLDYLHACPMESLCSQCSSQD